MFRRKKTDKSESTLTYCYRYRIYPTNGQVSALENTFSMCRHLYNRSLAERKDAYEQTGKGIGYAQQQNALPALKKQKPWYKGVHSQVLQNTLQRLDGAYQRFFERVKAGEKPGFPKFKKRGQWSSITYPQYKGTPGALFPVPKIGMMRCVLHRDLPDQATIKTMTIAKESGNRWFASFSFTLPFVPPALVNEPNTAIGIDLGCNDLYYGSDRSYVKAPKLYREAQANLKKLQRRFAKEKKQTPRWYKLLWALGKAHSRVARKRLDFLHKAANELLAKADILCCEDLRITHMTRRPRPKKDDAGHYAPNGAAAKGGLNKSILDAGWGTFLDILTYKAKVLGKRIVRVPPAYTSQGCSNCATIVKKTLSQRTHQCHACGYVAHRDHNAALNILRLGLESLGLAHAFP
jgi:putative transposase